MPDIWGKVGEIHKGREGSPFALGPREYKRVFRVETKNRHLGSIAACLAPGVPNWYAFYITDDGSEYDTLSLLVDKRATQKADEDDWCVWEVVCKYSTDLNPGGQPDNPGAPNDPGGADGGAGGGGGSYNHPELEPPDIEWDHEIFQIAPSEDLDGEAFVNSALQPFSPAPTFPVAVPVLMITRNELSYDRLKAQSYAYAVNDKMFLGAPPESVQCMPPKAKMAHKGPIRYWRVSYKLRFAVEEMNGGQGVLTWQPRILDAGLMQFAKPIVGIQNLQEKDLLTVPIMRGNMPTSQPLLLDGNGRVQVGKIVQQGGGKPPLRKMVPKYIERRMYRKLSFSKLVSSGVS